LVRLLHVSQRSDGAAGAATETLAAAAATRRATASVSHTAPTPRPTASMKPSSCGRGWSAGVRRDVAAGVKAAVRVVVAAHASANGRDATPVLRAGVPRVGEDEDAPRDGALLGRAEAGDVPAAARLPPGAVLELERHGIA